MAAADQLENAGQAAQNSRFIRLAVIGLGLLAMLAVGLWARYGSAVFLETMATAWAYCF